MGVARAASSRRRPARLDLSGYNFYCGHILGHLAFALPTGCLVRGACGCGAVAAPRKLIPRAMFQVSLVSRRSLVGQVVFAGTMVSLFVGWGAYVSIGETRSGLVRNGCFDWFLGTIPPNDTLPATQCGRLWSRPLSILGVHHSFCFSGRGSATWPACPCAG